jgi:hypothetical protein
MCTHSCVYVHAPLFLCARTAVSMCTRSCARVCNVKCEGRGGGRTGVVLVHAGNLFPNDLPTILSLLLERVCTAPSPWAAHPPMPGTLTITTCRILAA